MNKEIAGARAWLKRENRKWPGVMTRVPESSWPPYSPANAGKMVMVFRSSEFLAQVFDEAGGTRISVTRTRLNGRGDWDDGIHWDEMMKVKRECGFGEVSFVEMYPPDADAVNVANMRHLWLMPAGMELGWKLWKR